MLKREADIAWKFKEWRAVDSRYSSLVMERGIRDADSIIRMLRGKCKLGKLHEAKALMERYREYISIDDIERDIVELETLLSPLDSYELELLEDGLSYENLSRWFADRRWNLIYVAIKLEPKEHISLEKLAQFHYMVLVTLNMLGRRDEGIDIR